MVPCIFGRLRRRGRARPVQGAVSAASGMGRTAVWVPAEGDSAVQLAGLCGVRSEQSYERGSSREKVRSAPKTARGISRPTHESGGVGGLLVKGLEGVGGGGVRAVLLSGPALKPEGLVSISLAESKRIECRACLLSRSRKSRSSRKS